MGTPTTTTRTPPNTTPGQRVNSGVQACPLQAQRPCDVDKLVFEIEAREERPNTGGARPVIPLKLETTRVRRNEQPTGVRSRRAIEKLRNYDLIIETIGDFVDERRNGGGATPWKFGPFASLDTDPEDFVEVKTVRAHFHGRECSRQAHAELRFKAENAPELAGRTERVERRPGASELSLPPFRLRAADIRLDGWPSGANITAPFEIIASLFFATRPKDTEFIAASCGRRARGDAMRPNTELRALLRIYRRDKWTVGIKIPAFGRFTDTRQATTAAGLRGAQPATGDFSRQQGWQAGGGLLAGSTSAQRDGRTTTTSQEAWVAGYGVRETEMEHSRGQGRRTESSVQTSYDMNGGQGSTPNYGGTAARNSQVQRRQGTPKRTYAEFESRLERASDFDLVIARNGQEIGGREFLQLVQNLRTAIRNFGEAVVAIREAFRRFPQAGWKFEFDISVFQGMLILEWGPEQRKEAICNGRYIPVEYKFKGKIQIEIIKLKLELSFGIEVQAMGTGITGRVFGSIEFKAKIERAIDMNLLRPKQEFDIDTEGNVELGALARATVVGYTLVEGRLTVSSGLELRGSLEIDWERSSCDLKGTLKRKAILLSGTLRTGWWFGNKSINPPVQLLAESTIHTFR